MQKKGECAQKVLANNFPKTYKLICCNDNTIEKILPAVRTLFFIEISQELINNINQLLNIVRF